jgi:ParB-like chromosome segregation protein Spo0J
VSLRIDPIVVFETEAGLLLADGHHRLAAVMAENLDSIDADVRRGSRREAPDYAIAVGSVQRDLSHDEVERHLRDRYPT